LTSPSSSLPEATFAELLEATAPGVWVKISGPTRRTIPSVDQWKLPIPELELHCGATSCGGKRAFKPSPLNPRLEETTLYVGPNAHAEPQMLKFVCRNCGKSIKHFFVLGRVEQATVLLYKAGEYPSFGPPIPSRARS
jgi:hypothetical protein